MTDPRAPPVAQGAATARLGNGAHPSAGPSHPGVVGEAAWYVWWALPNRSPVESLAVSARVEALAVQPAPFGDGEPWVTLRYLTMLPPVKALAQTFASVAHIGPLWALVACGWLGLNRRACGLIALAMALDALLVGFCMASVDSLPRLQGLWIAMDVPLSVAPIMVVAAAAGRRLRAWVVVQRGPSPAAHCG